MPTLPRIAIPALGTMAGLAMISLLAMPVHAQAPTQAPAETPPAAQPSTILLPTNSQLELTSLKPRSGTGSPASDARAAVQPPTSPSYLGAPPPPVDPASQIETGSLPGVEPLRGPAPPALVKPPRIETATAAPLPPVPAQPAAAKPRSSSGSGEESSAEKSRSAMGSCAVFGMTNCAGGSD